MSALTLIILVIIVIAIALAIIYIRNLREENRITERYLRETHEAYAKEKNKRILLEAQIDDLSNEWQEQREEIAILQSDKNELYEFYLRCTERKRDANGRFVGLDNATFTIK